MSKKEKQPVVTKKNFLIPHEELIRRLEKQLVTIKSVGMYVKSDYKLYDGVKSRKSMDSEIEVIGALNDIQVASQDVRNVVNKIIEDIMKKWQK